MTRLPVESNATPAQAGVVAPPGMTGRVWRTATGAPGWEKSIRYRSKPVEIQAMPSASKAMSPELLPPSVGWLYVRLPSEVTV